MSDRFVFFFSDIHIHPHGGAWNRVEDGLKILDWVRQEAAKRDIQTLVFGGDFFHVRERIFSLVFNPAYKKLKEMAENGYKLYMLVGNHDMPLKHSTQHNNLSAFCDVAHIIDQPYVLKGDRYNFYMLPYIEDIGQLQWALAEMEKRKDPTKSNALLAHLDIVSAWYNSYVQSDVGVDAQNLSDKWDFVLSGHFHNFQKLAKTENVWYAGTPYQINFGDAGVSKGIIVFDDGKLDFIENTFTPKHIVIHENEIDERVKGQYVRLKATKSDNISEHRAKLELLGALSVDVQIEQENMISEDVAYVWEFKTNIDKLVSEWVNKSTFALDKDKLLSVGKTIIQEAQSV